MRERRRPEDALGHGMSAAARAAVDDLQDKARAELVHALRQRVPCLDEGVIARGDHVRMRDAIGAHVGVAGDDGANAAARSSLLRARSEPISSVSNTPSVIFGAAYA